MAFATMRMMPAAVACWDLVLRRVPAGASQSWPWRHCLCCGHCNAMLSELLCAASLQWDRGNQLVYTKKARGWPSLCFFSNTSAEFTVRKEARLDYRPRLNVSATDVLWQWRGACSS